MVGEIMKKKELPLFSVSLYPEQEHEMERYEKEGFSIELKLDYEHIRPQETELNDLFERHDITSVHLPPKGMSLREENMGRLFEFCYDALCDANLHYVSLHPTERRYTEEGETDYEYFTYLLGQVARNMEGLGFRFGLENIPRQKSYLYDQKDVDILATMLDDMKIGNVGFVVDSAHLPEQTIDAVYDYVKTAVRNNRLVGMHANAQFSPNSRQQKYKKHTLPNITMDEIDKEEQKTIGQLTSLIRDAGGTITFEPGRNDTTDDVLAVRKLHERYERHFLGE